MHNRLLSDVYIECKTFQELCKLDTRDSAMITLIYKKKVRKEGIFGIIHII